MNSVSDNTNAAFLRPLQAVTMCPGQYTTRSNCRVQITSADGPYFIGTILDRHTNRKRQWRWFPDGRSYGNDKWDDLVQ